MSKNRYLTKTRFKLGLECPTKLFYTGKPESFLNTKNNDDFLRSLAEGGFQVGELAKLQFEGGIEVTETEHEKAVTETAALLQRPDVTIYEAAIRAGDLFIRIDILKKSGNKLELIEVKAKSFDPNDSNFFVGKRGEIKPGILPYLQDVAFQKYVLTAAFPEATITAYLMMADKTKQVTVDGLNQRFKIIREGDRSKAVMSEGTSSDNIGRPVLSIVNVDELADKIISSEVVLPGRTIAFETVINLLARHYKEDRCLPPTIGKQCATCEFRTAEPDPRSGFHTCWKAANNWNDGDFSGGTVLDLWNFRKKDELIESVVLKLDQVTEEDLGIKPAEVGISRTERQWMQASGEWPGGGDFYLDKTGLQSEMATWIYPFHFIDFETSRVAVPFHIGRRPYEQTAFQFSHHIAYADGKIEHKGQFLDATPGSFPNYSFVRALRDQLEGDKGTIFRWSNHENTVLREIDRQLEEDLNPPPDKESLQDFIHWITEDSRSSRIGDRSMVDLCKIAERYYFHPNTNGSSSIKKVLPAVMSSSVILKQKYSNASYGTVNGIPSLNFTNWTWWRSDGSHVTDPYSLLPAVFDDLPSIDCSSLEIDDSAELANGGAALVAYSRLQFEDISLVERSRLEAALLKYCELDTLAMVMIWQAWCQDLSVKH